MTLQEWIEREGRGALTRIQMQTGLAYTTVLRAARGEPIRRETAERIAAATDDEVSISSLLVGAAA